MSRYPKQTTKSISNKVNVKRLNFKKNKLRDQNKIQEVIQINP